MRMDGSGNGNDGRRCGDGGMVAEVLLDERRLVAISVGQEGILELRQLLLELENVGLHLVVTVRGFVRSLLQLLDPSLLLLPTFGGRHPIAFQTLLSFLFVVVATRFSREGLIIGGIPAIVLILLVTGPAGGFTVLLGRLPSAVRSRACTLSRAGGGGSSCSCNSIRSRPRPSSSSSSSSSSSGCCSSSGGGGGRPGRGPLGG